MAAIRSGQIDAFANLDPVIAQLQKDDLLTIVADTRKVDESDRLFGGPMVAGCLYAPSRYIDQNPDIIQGLTNAVVRANRWLAGATAEDIVKTVPESYFMGNKDIYIEGFLKNRPALSVDGMIPEEAPSISLKALMQVNRHISPKRVDLTNIYTNEFVKAAQAKYPQ